MTAHERFQWGISDPEGYEATDIYDADADEVDGALCADDRSTQTVHGSGYGKFELGTSNVDWDAGEDGNHPDEEEEASLANDGSTQNVEDRGHSTRECEDWTVYFRPVKYNYGEVNAAASDVSEANTVL